jgi:hypothetical protein
MREFDGRHAPDAGDNGMDVSPENADDVREPAYEVAHDTAARRANALDYRQRVAAEYAEYDARQGDPNGTQVSYVPAISTDNPADRAAANHEPSDAATRESREPDEAATSAGSTEPLQTEDSRPPPSADQDEVRQLYREYLVDMARAGRAKGRDQGTNTVGPRPDRSPGEVSGLPPSGDELIELKMSRKARFAGLLEEAEKEENLGDLHDAVEEDANTVQRWLSARPPEGHAEQPVPAHHPYVTPWAPEDGIEAGSAASALMVTVILTAHMARWIDEKLRHWRDDHDVSNR